MKWYVFYRDDFFGNGGVGWQEFPDDQAALAFIETRLKNAPNPSVSDYHVIKGTPITLKAIETVTKIRFES